MRLWLILIVGRTKTGSQELEGKDKTPKTTNRTLTLVPFRALILLHVLWSSEGRVNVLAICVFLSPLAVSSFLSNINDSQWPREVCPFADCLFFMLAKGLRNLSGKEDVNGHLHHSWFLTDVSQISSSLDVN